MLNITNDSFSCYDPSVQGYRYFGVLWGSFVSVVGTVGNILTILAFATDSRLRTRFNVLIVNLAVADILYCTVLQPVSIDSYLHLHWRGGPLWCRIFGLLLFLSNSVSILTLCLIAVSRYLLVARRPVFERVFSRRGLALLLPSTWALGLASFGPLWSVYVFVPQVCTCSFHRTRGRPYSTILLFFYFFIGLGCVGFFYLLIYRRVRVAAKALVKYRFSRRSSRKKPHLIKAQGTEGDSGLGSGVATHGCEISSQGELAHNMSGDREEEHTGISSSSHTTTQGSAHASHSADPTGGEEPPPALTPAPPPPIMATPTPSAVQPSSSSEEDGEFKRVTRMCFTVFLCFVFCFVPFLLLNMADKQGRAPQALHMFCANLTWLNSCINPILYAAMNRQFGQAYKALLSRAASPLRSLWTH
ncbi:G-protein coupled receptor 84-like [Hypomesus transpacificus]|uniref:G-protein coupled receptor 84-like n=1 Tax=Hypomesus transpacificus TaxID=137520 RepID=UPI001F083E6C|nr:G-protein coupled receptor 84-like [Hypomesus transpacificus]